MGKDWDKALPPVEAWKECLRVLKPGAFAFIMCSPRQDLLSRMIVSLEDAGFNTSFTSMYWTYASGFPKAHNVGKVVDKQKGATREIVGYSKGIKVEDNQGFGGIALGGVGIVQKPADIPITAPATEEAKKLDGSYGGFQPKPAVEVILVVMKPMTEKTFTAQALDNNHGITWLDDCRVPYADAHDEDISQLHSKSQEAVDSQHIYGKYGAMPSAGRRTKTFGNEGEPVSGGEKEVDWEANQTGRFPANLLVSDEVLDAEGQKISQGHWSKTKTTGYGEFGGGTSEYNGVGPKNKANSYSRYFSLDAWTAKQSWLFDIATSYSSSNTFFELVNASFHHIQSKQDYLGSIYNLYEKCYALFQSVSHDTLLSHNKLNTYLSRDFPLVLHKLYKLLEHYASGNSLHNDLLANEVLCVESLKQLQDFLDDYQSYFRLCDAQTHLFQDTSPELSLLLSCVHKHILCYLQKDDLVEAGEYIFHRNLAYSYLLSIYSLHHIIYEVAGNYFREQLPKEMDKKVFPFFIVPKASKSEKGPDNKHPTVKPVKLMAYLITLGSREGEVVLDPFMGSGTTGIAAKGLKRQFIGIEKNPQYFEIAEERINE